MKAFGWYGEEHTVYTEDGYILKLYRLLSPYKDPRCKPPVLMMSGMGGNLETWILQGPQKDLGNVFRTLVHIKNKIMFSIKFINNLSESHSFARTMFNLDIFTGCL